MTFVCASALTTPSPHLGCWPLLQEILMVLFSFSPLIMLKKPNSQDSPHVPAPQQCHPSAWVKISVSEQLFITERTTIQQHRQQGPHWKKPAIINHSTTQRKPKREISHLQPDFILKPLPQQCPFLCKLQFRLCHIFHCNSNGRGLFWGGFNYYFYLHWSSFLVWDFIIRKK